MALRYSALSWDRSPALGIAKLFLIPLTQEETSLLRGMRGAAWKGYKGMSKKTRTGQNRTRSVPDTFCWACSAPGPPGTSFGYESNGVCSPDAEHQCCLQQGGFPQEGPASGPQRGFVSLCGDLHHDPVLVRYLHVSYELWEKASGAQTKTPQEQVTVDF